jgi:cyanate permease
MAAMPFAPTPWVATALAATCLAGGGGIFALLTADMLARVHPSQVSIAGGLTAAAQSIAYIATGPIVGRAVDKTHSYGALLVVLGGMVVPAMVAWALWPVAKSSVASRAGSS